MARRGPKKFGVFRGFRKGWPVHECVAIDVNTQRDFLSEDAVLPVQELDHRAETIRKMMNWVNLNHLPLVSIVDVHRPGGENIKMPLFHCIEGTPGQQKVSYTLMSRRYMIRHDCNPAVRDNVFDSYRQVIVQKRCEDVFINPKADRFLSRLQARRFVIFGVGLERGVKSLTLGLLSRGKGVIVVPEACACWDDNTADLALRQIVAKGAMSVGLAETINSEPIKLPVPGVEIEPEPQRHKITR